MFEYIVDPWLLGLAVVAAYVIWKVAHKKPGE